MKLEAKYNLSKDYYNKGGRVIVIPNNVQALQSVPAAPIVQEQIIETGPAIEFNTFGGNELPLETTAISQVAQQSVDSAVAIAPAGLEQNIFPGENVIVSEPAINLSDSDKIGSRISELEAAFEIVKADLIERDKEITAREAIIDQREQKVAERERAVDQIENNIAPKNEMTNGGHDNLQQNIVNTPGNMPIGDSQQMDTPFIPTFDISSAKSESINNEPQMPGGYQQVAEPFTLGKAA